MKAAGWLGGIAILTTASACRVATVRPLDGDTGKAQEMGAATAPFDAAKLVDSIWNAELLRAIETAQEIAPLVDGTTDPARSAPAGVRSIVVRGRGRVAEVDTRSRSGMASIELLGGASARVTLQVGPVLTGTAIRDAFASLGFDRFVNQMEHAEVGNELNARVEQGVLQQLDRARLRGRQVSFAGMATFEAAGVVTVTPVRLLIEERP